MFELFLSTFATLFVTIDPIGVLPLFLAISAPLGAAKSKAMATRGVAVATGILLFFAFAGNGLLSVLHVSIDAFRISGGILLLIIAIQMVFEVRTKRREEANEKAVQERENSTDADWSSLAIFPLAIPLMAGPGAMTSLLLLSAEYNFGQWQFWIVVATLLVIMVIAWVMFWLGGALSKYLRPQVTLIMTRVLGVILAALAIEFVISGVRGAFGV